LNLSYNQISFKGTMNISYALNYVKWETLILDYNNINSDSFNSLIY